MSKQTADKKESPAYLLGFLLNFFFGKERQGLSAGALLPKTKLP